MKKTRVFAMLMLGCGLFALTVAPAVAQHVPVTGPGDCPTACDYSSVPDPDVCAMFVMDGPGSECLTDDSQGCVGLWPAAPFAGMPTWDFMVYVLIDPDTGDFAPDHVANVEPLDVIVPAPGTVDFCAMSDQLYCSLAPFVDLLPEVQQFAFLVQCQNMDLNGTIDDCLEIPVQGNGVPDRYELAILGEVLNNTGHALHADATAAFKHNMDEIVGLIITALTAVDMGGDPPVIMNVASMAYFIGPWLMPTLGGILGGFAALGDPAANAALDELLSLLEDIGITPPEGGISAVAQSIPALGPQGDISGNGFTNREIYDWFIQTNSAMTVSEYVALAFDPASRPPARVAVGGAGNASIGDDVTLTADVTDAVGGTAAAYQWYKWGVTGQDPVRPQCDLYGWVVIPDATGSALVISNAQEADSGNYAVGVDIDTGKAVEGTIMASASLLVSDASNVPVGSALGLTLLAGACALAGAVGIRRRK